MDVDGELIKRQNIPLQLNFQCLMDLQMIFFRPLKIQKLYFSQKLMWLPPFFIAEIDSANKFL